MPPGGGADQLLRRWGPIMAIVAVVGIVVAIVVATTSGDKKAAPTTTTAAATSSTSTGGSATTAAAPSTTVAGQIPYPLSFQQAEEQGITGVQWGPRCDTNSGRLAVPDFFSPSCFAPFKGNNGGATAPGVTATSIKIVYYQAQEGDPVIASITDAVNVNETNAQQAETMKGIVKFYEAFFETYGRHIELKGRAGFGYRHRRRRGACRRDKDRREREAIHGLGRSRVHRGVRRRARGPPYPVHRVHARTARRLVQGAIPTSSVLTCRCRRARSTCSSTCASNSWANRRRTLVTPRCSRRPASSVCCTSRRVRTQRRWPTTSPPR